MAKLLADLPLPVPEDLRDKAMVLDAHSIPARHPNGHDEGPPFRHYGKLQSEEAIRYAREILAFVRDGLARA